MVMEQPRETVFITGGAGFLGINLVRHLLSKGYQVVSYDLLPFDYPERAQITEVEGDIRDPGRLQEAMKGSDLVVHTAAALPLYSEADIYSTDVDGTRNVMEAAAANGVKRVVYISSTAVYGVPDHHPLYETDSMIGVGPYGKAKIEAEKLAASFRDRGLVVPIIRPKSFVGPERLGVFALFYDWAKDGKGFPILGNGKNRYQLLDVEDLCEAIYLCLSGPADKVNDVFNIGAKEYSTMREDYQAVLDAAGHGKKIKAIPAGPAIAMLKVLEAMKLSPLYKWVYETAAKDSFVSIDKAEKVLGYAPRYSNKDAMVRNYRWYLDNYDKFAHQSGVTHRVPWKQGALGIAKMFF
jgi:nucleoside-diphosphate-sugar epimerase